MTELRATSGQTIGPFFGYALPFSGDNNLVPPGHASAIQLTGRVLDGAGVGVPDALLEIWQPDPDGLVVQRPGSLHRDGHSFTGWGRAATDPTGTYSFTTLRPGSMGESTPFIAVTLFARGLLDRLFTRIYLPEGDEAVTDPALAGLDEGRRSSMVARERDRLVRFDIHLQGPQETVFLEYRDDHR